MPRDRTDSEIDAIFGQSQAAEPEGILRAALSKYPFAGDAQGVRDRIERVMPYHWEANGVLYGLNYKLLAEKAGITPPTLRKYRRNPGVCPSAVATKIAVALGYGQDYLDAGEGNVPDEYYAAVAVEELATGLTYAELVEQRKDPGEEERRQARETWELLTVLLALPAKSREQIRRRALDELTCSNIVGNSISENGVRAALAQGPARRRSAWLIYSMQTLMCSCAKRFTANCKRVHICPFHGESHALREGTAKERPP